MNVILGKSITKWKKSDVFHPLGLQWTKVMFTLNQLHVHMNEWGY